jgi:AraC-like DNA-binding protein
LRIHRHDFTELVIVLEGSGDHLFDDNRFPITTGDAFVIDVHHAHGYERTQSLEIVNVLFDEGFLLEREPALAAMPSYQAFVHLEPRARRRLDFAGKLRLGSVAMGEVRVLVRRLEHELAVQDEGYAPASVSLLVELIVLLCRAYSQEENEGHRDLTDIGRVVGYLESRYTEHIELADLLDVVAMSERSLLRKFSLATGTTPIQYLMRVRVAHAERLLRETATPITEIAGAVGFEDSNYFSRQFRQVIGMSPREYRRSSASS